MDFKTFFRVFHIKAYLGTQIDALEKLLKAIVRKPDDIAYAKSTLSGFIHGDRISQLAMNLIQAGFSSDRMSAYIKSLYPLKPKPTYAERYHNKPYVEALYDNVKQEFPDMKMDEVAEYLTKEFSNLIRTENEKSDKKAKPWSEADYVKKHTITDDKKKAIVNACNLIIEALREVKFQTNRIINKQDELKHMNMPTEETLRLWKKHVEYDLKYLSRRVREEYSKLEELCYGAITMLEPRKHMHTSLAEVYTIATELLDNRAKFDVTCPDTFSYDALTKKLSEFTKHVKLLSAYFKEH